MRISFMFITIALMKGAVSAQCTFGPDTPQFVFSDSYRGHISLRDGAYRLPKVLHNLLYSISGQHRV
jgi:hypothetical protein